RTVVPTSMLERSSDAVIPKARCRAARQCLGGSESRNRLGGGNPRGRFLLLCFRRKSSGRRTLLLTPCAGCDAWCHHTRSDWARDHASLRSEALAASWSRSGR